MKLFVILAIVIYFAICYLLAKEFENIAQEKGYSDESKYFWYPFIFGIMGMLMVVALPDRGKHGEAEKRTDVPANRPKFSDDELPNL